MNSSEPSLTVAIFATNDPRNYSGGRYMSLMMAYALASAGCSVTVYTNHLPSFDADLSPLAPGQVDFVVTGDFRDGVVAAPLDWVVLIPTGIFLPGFYEAVTEHAAACGARLAVVNFESANWYNATSPHPRDARLWDSWRRACLDGALVLSIAREGLAPARDFYVSPHAAVQHDVWYPPINSPLAEQYDGRPRRPLIVSFVRPSDPHKGGLDLLALPPGLLAGHELALVAGRDIDPAYLESVQRHFAAASGARISVHTRISDAAKLQLLSEAKLLLFPSYFEGYGYPPIEALYCGTPVVCYDLPVLRETVGEVAHFAPPGDNGAFAATVAAALGESADPAVLRRAVHRFAHFPTRADALVDLLVRHADGVPVRRPPAFLASLGPVAGTKPRAPGPRDLPPLPPLPFHLTDARTLADGRTAITALTSSLTPLDGATASTDGRALPVMLQPAETALPLGLGWRVHLVLPAGLPAGIDVTIDFHAAGAVVAQDVFRLREAAPVDDGAAPVAGVLSVQRMGGQLFLHAWALAAAPVEQVAIGMGDAGTFVATVCEERPELEASHPGHGSYRAGFALTLPAADLPPEGLDLLLIGGGRTLGALPGWLGQDGADAGIAVRRGRRVPPPARLLAPADLNNSHWRHGISLFGDVRAPSVFTTYDGAASSLAAGARLRFPGGTVASVVQVQKKSPFWNVYVDRPLSPYRDGHPASVEIVDEPRVPGNGRLDYATDPEDDPAWQFGVCVAPGEHHGRTVRLKARSPVADALEPLAVLHFAHAGARTVLTVDEVGDTLLVGLDAPVGPVCDGAPKSVQLKSLPHPGDRLLSPVSTADFPGGLRADGGPVTLMQVAADEAAAGLAPGMALRFADAGILPVEAVDDCGDHLRVTVAGLLDSRADGAPHAVHRLAEPASLLCPRRPAVYPVPAFVAPDPFHLKLAGRVEARWRTTAPETPAPSARPRVLFLTLVPPTPANQGNRVVTRNLIRHLIELGYDVDVVMQGWIDVPAFITEFGARARLYHCAFPNWQDSAEAKARQQARRDLKPALTGLHADIDLALSNYHPYFIVRDETVDRARGLLQAARYDSIVCNYLHMARVVKELEGEFALPRTCVITHDALSNLTRELGHTALDTMYRACTPQTERDALNAVDDGVAVAISCEEQRYFRDIGVHLPIVLCEYDAADEFADGGVDHGAFAAQTLFYAASSNPLNLAGLGWFLDECWPAVLAAVPQARLVVCGPICSVLPQGLPHVTLAGNVERVVLLGLMRESSVGINPCLVGTGLKIKTVETACLGLPAVCLPAAVDGLRDVADGFAITAEDAAGFAAGCITLLTDATRWQALHEGGLAAARQRFSHDRVYREIDAAMGWRRQPGSAPAGADSPAQAGTDGAPPVEGAAATDGPEGPLLELAQRLTQAGEHDFAHQLAERAAALAPTSARCAAAAARLGIDARQPWLGALHAARLVAGAQGVHAEAYALLGEALLAQARDEAARDALLQAAAIAPGDAAVYRHLAQAAERLGAHELLAWALRQTSPGFRLGDTLALTVGGNGIASLASGWSAPEAWGVWSDGDAPVLELKLDEAVTGPLQITLLCHGFTPVPDSCRKVSAVVGRHTLGEVEFRPGMEEHAWSFGCPAELLHDGRCLTLTLRVAQPESPIDLGLSSDRRRLGINLHALRVESAAASTA